MNQNHESPSETPRHVSPLRVPAYFHTNFGKRKSRQHMRTLLRYLLVLVVLVGVYATIFTFLMMWEGQQHSFITGIYWSLTVMSTLGFGDITFTSNIGRIFSIFVLLSGMVFLLVLLPFTFIEFFYAPWIEARTAARVPRDLPADIKGHVILTFYGPIASTLTQKLSEYNYPYVVVLPEFEDALRLNDAGVHTVFGALDDPETYARVRVENASLVATTRSDVVNTTVAFTVRAISSSVPIVATAREDTAVEVLKLAGTTQILRLDQLIGRSLARRTRGGKTIAHVVGQIGGLILGEVNAVETKFVGKKLADLKVSDIEIVGLWDRGKFEIPRSGSVVQSSTVFIVAGTAQQLAAFDSAHRAPEHAAESVIIVGGGRVGRATAEALAQDGLEYRIVELLPERIRDPKTYVLGSASNHETLTKAGIESASAVILTTHDDETNIFLAIFCRLLRPDIQIISRATLERNVAPLHRAGADFVFSSASMGANVLFNLLRRGDLLMVAEGLDVFKVNLPRELFGLTVREADIFGVTGCNIVAVESDNDRIVNPNPDCRLKEGAEIVLIGTVDGRSRFLKRYLPKARS